MAGEPAIPTVVVSASPDRTATPVSAAAGASGTSHIRFGDVLSALNPLQYLPVVGTIYRAVTGDTIPEGLRLGGSLLLGGLMGGPIGLITTIATTIAEKVTGIDPDKIARTVLADVGLAAPVHSAKPAAAAATARAGTVSAPAATQSAPPAADWTSAGLIRAGVTFGADGTPVFGGQSGADALNQVELGRIRVAAAAYAQTAALHG